MPFVALVHFYFSMQGEGIELRQTIFFAAEEQNQRVEDFSFTTIWNFISESLATWSRSQEHYHRSNYMIYDAALLYNLKKEQRSIDLHEDSQVDPRMIMPALIRNEPLLLRLKSPFPATSGAIQTLSFYPNENNKLLWLKAFLALNIGGISRGLEAYRVLIRTSSITSVLSENQEKTNQQNDHDDVLEVSQLKLFVDLITEMENFNLREVVPSEIIPEDAFDTHVLPFL